MLEAKGNLWNFKADAYCITTNGIIKRDGRAVMGAGIALEALNRFPGIDERLGEYLNSEGNHVYILNYSPFVVSFPTKHDWRKPSSFSLIKQSAWELASLATDYNWSSVVLPRPGCGLGQLDWNDVRPMLKDYLDDRFTVITF